MGFNYLVHAHYEHVLLIIKNSTFLKQSFTVYKGYTLQHLLQASTFSFGQFILTRL